MKLIVGLGNPDRQYASTRHNAGFWIADAIATASGSTWDSSRDFKAEVTRANIDGQTVVLAKPTTYMNNSGTAVQAILHWYKLPVEEMLVVYDEVAIPLGKVRWQHNGGAGGHHGIENIMQMLGGNKAFDRLRFGVGPDPGGDRRADFVLSTIPAEDAALKDKVIGLCIESIRLWMRQGLQTTANKYNGLDLRPPPPPPPPPSQKAEPKSSQADN
ncbi:MAG TPA: aminoacyl-tRNA hydrolase [Candidatus Obscuribacterales bacterium]